MPGRSNDWKLSPGETQDLGVSMDSDLDDSASMTGETPVVSAWTRADDGTYSAAAGFTFANEQVNAAATEVKDKNGRVIETIAIGRGILFRVTAPTTPGEYFIRSECDADDGTHVVRTPFDRMVVEGPGSPS